MYVVYIMVQHKQRVATARLIKFAFGLLGNHQEETEESVDKGGKSRESPLGG